MKIRIKFAKEGTMKFIGHLDIMRYFQKVMRRADVDIRYTLEADLSAVLMILLLQRHLGRWEWI